MSMKFKIENPEQFNEVQKQLLKLGHKWKDSGGKEIEAKKGKVFIYVDDCIHYGSSLNIYEVHKGEEKTLDDLIAMNKKDDNKLLNGDEAKLAWANGSELQAMDAHGWKDISMDTTLAIFDMPCIVFRLKPKTVTINGIEYNKVTRIESDYSKHTIKIQLSSREDTEKLRKYIAETFLYK